MAKYTPEMKWDFAISKVLHKILIPKGWHKHPRFGMIGRMQINEDIVDRAKKAAILMQRDFKQELIKIEAEKLARKVAYAKEFSWFGRVLLHRGEYLCLLSEISTLETVIMDIENLVPSTVTESDFRDWPSDLKVGDFVFDAGMLRAIQIESAEEVAIYAKNWKKNRFATIDEINKVINESGDYKM